MKKSNLLKAICYMLIPILLIIILINIISIAILVDNPNEIKQGKSYYETESFREDYMNIILLNCNAITRYQISSSQESSSALEKSDIQYYNGNNYIVEDTKVAEDEQIQNYIKQKEESQKENAALVEGDTYQEENGIYMLFKENENYSLDASNDTVIDYKTIKAKYYDILIIKDGMAYTNIEKTVKTDTLDELKQYISQKQYHWIYEENINTDISTMQYDEIAYKDYFTQIQGLGFKVYSCVRDTNANQFIINTTMYNMVSKTYQNAPICIIFSGIILMLIIAYLISSIGHSKNHEDIYTNWLDKIPLEILVIIIGIMLVIEGLIFMAFTELLYQFFTTAISLLVLMGIIIYATVTTFLVTIIRRIKAKIFWKNTIIYKIIKYLDRKTEEIKLNLSANMDINMKIICIFIISVIVTTSLMILTIAKQNLIFILFLIAFWIYLLYSIIKYVDKMHQIREAVGKIYKGDNNYKLNEENFTGELQKVAKELNNISDGLSDAIEESLKSERLKTELITNVSHDIKTPLTSIINYVDLLKKEDIQNETAREYLQILDNKSQRLKKLTEDLIEASKASSGNIKLNIEKLNLGELLKQVRGEFEDKLHEKNLEIIENIPKDEVCINADSRYMYRVMENLFTNIAKYALENSRVYIDLIVNGKDENKKAYIILKNISQEKLNITADELMQRFVRGDSSRTEGGSGLGLSIAKSLVELQKGKFEMQLDGDLFKVIIEF